ncbi:hypothetical protein A2635_00975 [Candidatus Peribacteria bacterium RIFCSPHIGHO2_01_FULL_51_9]|nr:MAG: hypothetical protein A2635_00975 [Candidatus Peribacteria bacterium RIFCSPHIGHO2_01_FULL_51_9]
MSTDNELSFVVESPQGLHVRPADRVVQYTKNLSQTHPGVTLLIDQPSDEIPDATLRTVCGPGPYPTNSILSLLSLAAIGRRFQFILRGPEEKVLSLIGEVEQSIREILQ